MLNIYLVLGTENSLKSIVFMKMVDFLVKHKQLESVMIDQVRDIANLSADWYLQKEERINLYIHCGQALDTEADHRGAFKVYFQAFKLINSLSAKEQKEKTRKSEAESLIISALKSPEVINLEEIMLLEAIQELKNSSKEIFGLATTILTSEMKAFSKDLDKYKKVLDDYKVSRDLVEEKKRFITICSLDIEESTGRVLKF